MEARPWERCLTLSPRIDHQVQWGRSIHRVRKRPKHCPVRDSARGERPRAAPINSFEELFPSSVGLNWPDRFHRNLPLQDAARDIGAVSVDLDHRVELVVAKCARVDRGNVICGRGVNLHEV